VAHVLIARCDARSAASEPGPPRIKSEQAFAGTCAARIASLDTTARAPLIPAIQMAHVLSANRKPVRRNMPRMGA